MISDAEISVADKTPSTLMNVSFGLNLLSKGNNMICIVTAKGIQILRSQFVISSYVTCKYQSTSNTGRIPNEK